MELNGNFWMNPIPTLFNQNGLIEMKLWARNNPVGMFIWTKGIIWRWEKGGLRAPQILLHKFSKISQGSPILLHKIGGPVTPHFLTSKWSLWVISTSPGGYFSISILFQFTQFGWTVPCEDSSILFHFWHGIVLRNTKKWQCGDAAAWEWRRNVWKNSDKT